MTSIMSSDQRKQLQQAAATSKEADTLERDTAKPPSSAQAEAAAAEIVIPKAPATPSVKPPEEPSSVEAKVEPEEKAKVEAPAPAPIEAVVKLSQPAAAAGMATWELVAFVLLAVAVAIALKT